VGQDEDPEPLVRRADFCRAEQACRRRVAHAPKLSQDGFEAESDVARDVFEEDPFWAAFPDDTGDLGPEVAEIIGTTAFASGAEGLAGISRKDDVEGSTEDPSIETAEIVPDWCRGEIPCALCGDENGSGPILPLDEGPGVISGFGEHDAQIQASAACAERQSVPGT
jgi:hypothetical protein